MRKYGKYDNVGVRSVPIWVLCGGQPLASVAQEHPSFEKAVAEMVKANSVTSAWLKRLGLFRKIM